MNEIKLFIQSREFDNAVEELRALSHSLRKSFDRLEKKDEQLSFWTQDIIEKKIGRAVRSEVRKVFRELLQEYVKEVKKLGNS